MERRPTKQNDQEQTEIAFQLFNNLMNEHPEIEPTLWGGVCWAALANGYKASGSSYDLFFTECLSAILHYKKWWEDDN